MCDQTEIKYPDGDVVWVKLGSCWWPGEVVGPEKLPPDVLPSFRKPPIAVVKFFQEDSYEYVKNVNGIYKYNCSRKDEFINKGLYMYRTKHGHMEKFPEDVIRAETAVGGDIEILTRDEFQEVKKESYAGIFGDSAKKTPASSKKGRVRGGPESPKITLPIRKPIKDKSDYKVHILLQKKEVPISETPSTPSTSRAGSDIADDKTPKADVPATQSTPGVSTPAVTPVPTSGIYACPSCPFNTSRLNVLILHNKTHSVTYTAYTPSPVSKKPTVKPTKTVSPKINKTAKAPRQRKAKPEKPIKKEKTQGKKRSAESKGENSTKKPKTDAEIKSSLLADWDVDDNSNDESSGMVIGTESPAVPTPEDLPSALIPADIPSDIKSDEPSSTDKPESSSDSKYEFCEDEEWHVEADIGRKIPRVKNPKRKESNKSLSLDEDEVAKEVTELLNKTTLPALPSIPEPLKVEENFPEPSIIKSPDKKPEQLPPETKPSDVVTETKPTKAIFKTKTFFRSRHSRSQDAIGKYIAEQLNAAERMDMVDSDLNGSEVASFPEARELPPVEPVKVARLAPKIQLKKMKAEAAQLLEKEKSLEQTTGKPELEQESSKNQLQDVLWGTQEIKPINKESPEKSFAKEGWREEHLQFSKKKLLEESPLKVCTEPESVTLPKHTDLEDSLKNLSNEELTVITDTYIEPNIKADELNASASIIDPSLSLTENTINVVTETNTESGILPKTSPENTNSGSNVTTPKGSPIKLPSDNGAEECHQTPINAITHMSRMKTKDDEKSPAFDFNSQDNAKKSPIKIVIQNSTQKTSENNQKSPNRMVIDKKVLKCKEDDQNSLAEMVIENNQTASKNDDRLPNTMIIDKSAVKHIEDEQNLPMTKVIGNSPQKSSENYRRSPMRTNIDRSVPKCIKDKTLIKPVIASSLQKSPENNQVSPMDNTTSMKIDELKFTVDEGRKSPVKIVIGNSPQKSLESVDRSPIRKVITIMSTPIITKDDQISSTPIKTKNDQISPIKITDRLSPKKSLDSIKPHSEAKELQHNTKAFSIETFMSESTASAVDALLSVSREADRVPRIVGNDPPEDLFEDDHKDSVNNDEEFLNSNLGQDNDAHASIEEEQQAVEIEKTHDTIENSEKKLSITVTQGDDDIVLENIPSESDLQIAEALINLPSTTIKNKTNDVHENLLVPINISKHDIFVEEIIPSEGNSLTNNQDKAIKTNEVESILCKNMKPESKNQNIRFETEQEKSENFSAAQSLVQMSESVDHNINIVETKLLKKDVKATYIPKQNNRKIEKPLELQEPSVSNENDSRNPTGKITKFETTSSKLMKMLEAPSTLKPNTIIKTTPLKQVTPIKQMIVTGKEKILNFDVAKSSKDKTQPSKQKIIIRRAGPSKGFLNNLNEAVASPDKIILSRSNISTDGSSVQTFTIQAPPPQESQPDCVNQIVIQPKIHKLAKTPTKFQKIKPQTISQQYSEPQATEQSADLFDINSMPVLLSEDILTPESIEKMPIVMSDGNIMPSPTPNPPKLIKSKPTILENEKMTITAAPKKSEVKTLVMSSASDATKATTPNILSKSSKLRGGKPMLIIDKATGMQKIIMTKPEPVLKELKQATSLIQHVSQPTPKSEKFIILPSANSPRPTGRTQKIVIDPQTGKAHVFIAKGQDAPQSVSENKPVSAKLIPSSSDATSSSNPTVMIITNAQGAQSRIVLTPEHEKILFPNKQLASGSQLKTITHRITTNPGLVQKTVVTTNAGFMQKTIVTSTPVKQQTKVVSKQKGAIITSKGQLIVGGRIASTTQKIAPMPEVRQIVKPVTNIRPVAKPEIRQLAKLDTRPTLKRIVTSEPKKLVQAIQKNSSEPLIFLQQKSGAVMQLTAAQFEHLQRTGQIVQKIVPPTEKKIVVQKSITIPAKGSTVVTQKQRVRKHSPASHTLAKRAKQDINVSPAPKAHPPVPPLTSLSNTFAASVSSPAPAPTVTISSIIPNVITASPVATTQSYSDFDNFEEMLPSTAIARPPEPVPAPEPQPEPEIASATEPAVEAPPAQLSDGQLLAVPGESVGGLPGAFYLCMEENGTFTPIDNRPLILENNQLVPIAVDSTPVYQQPERRDILEAALANSDVFHADTPEAPDFRDLNANVSVHCRVSETSTTLNQPIMTPVEVPSKGDFEPTTVPSNLEDGLAVIGVTPHSVPTSLELPITVTDPRIAPKTTDPLSNNNYGTILVASPNTDMTYMSVAETETSGGISMPLLTDDESVGKSMPILTDEVAVSSVDSMESEESAGVGWARRLLTPSSDTSEISAEIPLQPHIQLSIADLSTTS